MTIHPTTLWLIIAIFLASLTGFTICYRLAVRNGGPQ